MVIKFHNRDFEYHEHFFFQAEDGIRDVERSRGLGDVYKRQLIVGSTHSQLVTVNKSVRHNNCWTGYRRLGFRNMRDSIRICFVLYLHLSLIHI